MRIVFMGTPEIAQTVLERLVESKHHVVAVVTNVDKARNRGKKIQYSPVKETALANSIPVIQPQKVKDNPQFYSEMEKINADIFVVVAYGHILPKEILDMPKYGSINVHASLLPKLRGAAPIQWSIIEGYKKTGVTIMQMTEDLDAGDMIAKKELEIGKSNSQELSDKLAKLGSELLIKTLDDIESGNYVKEKQDESQATYTSKISKQDGKIDFSMAPDEISRRCRGFDPWPGMFCDYQGNVMKIWKCEDTGLDIKGLNGEVVSVEKDCFLVACGGKGLRVTEVQMPGKKRVEVREFLKGNSIEVGTVLK